MQLEGIVSVPKSSTGGSSSESKKAAVSVVGGLKPPPAADQEGLKCPRCNSLNTKFCYYNNYSLTQPRHFCKSCRRYWTKGGALRNVPIGGGCRKNKKITNNKLMMICTNSSSCSSVSSHRTTSMISTNSDHDHHQPAAVGSTCHLIKPHQYFSDTLRLFHGVTTPAANIPDQSPLDSFHQYSLPAFSARLQPGGVMNHFLSFSNMSISPNSTSCSSINGVSAGAGAININPSLNSNSAGYGYNDHVAMKNCSGTTSELASSTGFCGYAGGHGLILGHDHHGDHNSMASSIESLSSMNADLHWKLQQQRLQAMFLGGGDQHQNHHKRPIMNNLDGLIVQNHQSGYYHQDHQKQQHEQQSDHHPVCNDQINVINVAEAKAGTGGRSSSFRHEEEFGEVKEQQTSVNGDHQWVFESPWQDLHQYSTTALR